MPSVPLRLSPLRKAFVAAAAFLGLAVFLMLFAPLPIASAASGILVPGAYLAWAIGLRPGFITLLLSYYFDFAIYAAGFAFVLGVVEKYWPNR